MYFSNSKKHVNIHYSWYTKPQMEFMLLSAWHPRCLLGISHAGRTSNIIGLPTTIAQQNSRQVQHVGLNLHHRTKESNNFSCNMANNLSFDTCSEQHTQCRIERVLRMILRWNAF